MLMFMFVDLADYDEIKGMDKINILGLDSFVPGKQLTLVVRSADGSKEVH
jgi:aconitate hydratase